jgi:integrase
LDVTRADEYTVAAWTKVWFELYSKPNIRPNTANYYSRMIDNYVVPNIGEIKLSKLTARDLQQLYNDLKDHGRVRESLKAKSPGLSSSYVRGLHRMLHSCLDRAVKERLLLRNPADDCIPPKAQKQEMKILHPDHISSYLHAADERGILPMFFLELTCGLRKGELVALLWSDLDVTNKTLSVSKQALRKTGGKVEITQPKTDTSIREISIPQETIDLLIQEHKKHPDSPYLFPSPVTGEMYHPDSVAHLHQKILKDAGLEHIRFHDLRHTFATLALQNGVDVKTVSSMLGHADAGFTLRTYTHATRQKQDEAAATMGNLMAQAL